MRLPQTNVLVCWLVVVVSFICLIDARGKKRNGNRNRSVCKYKSSGFDGDCDSDTDTKPVTLKLKGRRSDPSCAPTKIVKKPCNDFSMSKRNKKRKAKKTRCKYDRRNRQVSDCDPDTNRVTITIPLKSNLDSSACDPVKTKTKVCRPRHIKQKNRNKGCSYMKQPWAECNPDTNTRRREMILVKGDSTKCQPKKVVFSKSCKEGKGGAKGFIKGEWGPCDPNTGQKQRTLTPKPGSPPDVKPVVQTRSCRVRAELTAPKSNKCKYNLGEWSSCDPRTNTMTQTMTLKSGDPNVCMREKKLTRKCKIACKFRHGEWSECDEKTELATRVDTLVKGNARECEPTREITKKCKRACKYTFGDWGDCNPETNLRSRMKKLAKGDPEKCKAEEVVSKPCTKRDGGERCFFGPWGDFGPCHNGVTTKHKKVLSGGVECERKAVITKPCN